MASRLSMSNVSSKPAARAERSSCLSLVAYSETKLAHRFPSCVIAADASVARGCDGRGASGSIAASGGCGIHAGRGTLARKCSAS